MEGERKIGRKGEEAGRGGEGGRERRGRRKVGRKGEEGGRKGKERRDEGRE